MKKERSGKLSLLFIYMGLVITGVDFFSTLKGWEICPFEGCKLAFASSYSSLLGVPLTVWGVAFFLVAFFLWFFPKKWLFFWSALGLGASLYFLYLQRFVLGKMCIMCMAVEFLVFLLFLSAFTSVSFWCLFSVVALAFLGLHTAYTWAPYQDKTCFGTEEMKLLCKYYTTGGKGPGEAAFFFSLGCPACSRVLPLVREWSLKRGVRVVLREVRIHKEEDKAFYFFSLLKGGMDPWEALTQVEESKAVPRVDLDKREKSAVLRLLDFNERILNSLGIDGVPVLLVVEGGRVEGRQGIEGIRSLVAPPKGEERGSAERNRGYVDLNSGGTEGGSLFVSPGGVCTPRGCD